MTELLTAAQMRAIERAAIESGEVTGLELMERAGRGVVEAIFEEWPELKATSHRAVVLCGPGNNGGDGFVVARLLHDWGWEVEVFLYGEAEKLPPDARVNYERWLERGEVERLIDSEFEDYTKEKPKTALIVDAIFGIGLKRPFYDLPMTRDELNYCARSQGPVSKVVALDVPSGFCADSGRFKGYEDGNENPIDGCILSTLTVTFHSEKIGHRVNLGQDACGKVIVADIGLGVKAITGHEPADEPIQLLAEESIGHLQKRGWHKFNEGHALVLSGPSSRTGAARLAARGALRIGTGLVTVACPTDAQGENAAQLNSIMLRACDDGEMLLEILGDSRINAICIGPGLGVDRAPDLVRAALSERPAVVLDADALTAFQDAPEDLFAMLHSRCVLTPHGGEFKRLFPDIHEKLTAPATKGPAYSKVDATRDAAKLAGCVVLFKGPDTVIADPQGGASINSAHYDRAAPWLATAGSGDVLAGLITGLLARGFEAKQAAETAAWLHVECAREFGPGLIAEDLPEMLPAVFRKLGL